MEDGVYIGSASFTNFIQILLSHSENLFDESEVAFSKFWNRFGKFQIMFIELIIRCFHNHSMPMNEEGTFEGLHADTYAHVKTLKLLNV